MEQINTIPRVFSCHIFFIPKIALYFLEKLYVYQERPFGKRILPLDFGPHKTFKISGNDGRPTFESMTFLFYSSPL